MGYVLQQMQLVRDITSIFDTLRINLKISNKYPLLDYAFGGKDVYLDKNHQRLLAEGINIYNQGYDFSDKDFYYGFDIEKPKGENWRFLEKNNIWVELNITQPNWLKLIGDKRKEERQTIMKRKNYENMYYNKRFL